MAEVGVLSSFSFRRCTCVRFVAAVISNLNSFGGGACAAIYIPSHTYSTRSRLLVAYISCLSPFSLPLNSILHHTAIIILAEVPSLLSPNRSQSYIIHRIGSCALGFFITIQYMRCLLS
ncbi:hypothetical protein BKA65DRAFT_35715 [Rhexocercosporidium sp. MPI-PUGE-AT-0058]|nr:hypothetical protein BKA65DRAFT_35715 [Rhexocercosporidium sp. MPI-PUGE-AT-0058]